jgi:hypothetical protein
MTTSKSQRSSFRVGREHIIPALCSIILVVAYFFFLRAIWSNLGVDWRQTYRTGARAIFKGQNPYQVVPTFRNPVWILLPLAPFAFLPDKLGSALMLVMDVSLYAFVAHRLKARPIAFTAFMLSPAMLFSHIMLNIDPFILFGFILPAPIGLLFVLAKPQIGLGVCIYWLIEAWRNGGIRKALMILIPSAIAIACSFILYGNWVAQSVARDKFLLSVGWNDSLWPYGLVVGMALLIYGILKRDKVASASASPFLSPYVFLPSWSSALIILFRSDVLMVTAVVAMWIRVFMLIKY